MVLGFAYAASGKEGGKRSFAVFAKASSQRGESGHSDISSKLRKATAVTKGSTAQRSCPSIAAVVRTDLTTLRTQISPDHQQRLDQGMDTKRPMFGRADT